MATAKRKPAAPPPSEPKDDVEWFYDVEQGTDEWRELRRGIVTASVMSLVLADGKDGKEAATRRSLINRLAAEIITGVPIETYRNADMERGSAAEPEARDYYARTRFADLRRVGFVRRVLHLPFGSTLTVGCSPDSQIGEAGGLEIKSMRGDLLVDVIRKGPAGMPPEHRAQCQGTLWVTGWKRMDLMLYWPRMPAPVFAIERDEPYIAKLAQQVEVFDHELRRVVEDVRKRS